jgi:hypothetical protein
MKSGIRLTGVGAGGRAMERAEALAALVSTARFIGSGAAERHSLGGLTDDSTVVLAALVYAPGLR